MKILLILLLGLASGAQALEAVKPPKLVFPDDVRVKFVAEEQPFTAWLFDRWSALGYVVPKDGDTFKWGDVAKAINPVNVKVDDCIAYLDKDGEATEALVIATDLKDQSMIAVVEPLPGMLLYHVIERKAIQGVCRPLKKVNSGHTFLFPPPPVIA